ncbi:MAG: molecular chaperone HscB [Paraglaciecola sp.]|jgi:molecular chaperone HscB
MLELRGVELKHEQQTMQDSMFLMQQMQWREQLEEVDSPPDPLSELDVLDIEIQQHINQALDRLESLLFEHSASSDDAGANVVRKLKFFYKLKNEIAIKEEALSNF